MKIFVSSLFLVLLGPGALAKTVVSTNGKCGTGITCIGSYYGNCCSQWNWCGSTDDFCGAGCLSAFGSCSSSLSSTKASTLSTLKGSSSLVPSKATTSAKVSSKAATSSGISSTGSTASCGLVGYDSQNPSSYDYDGTAADATLAACGSRCQKSSTCLSFAFGSSACLLYTKVVANNIKLDSASPYTFYDVSCLSKASSIAPSSTSSNVAPSSSSKGSSSSQVLVTTSSTKTTSSSKVSTTASSTKTTSSVFSSKVSSLSSASTASSASDHNSPSPSTMSCGLIGYDLLKPASFSYNAKASLATLPACSALCKATSGCLSFAFGSGICDLYKAVVAGNFKANPSSPYAFYDLICPTSSAISSSSLILSSTASSSISSVVSSSSPTSSSITSTMSTDMSSFTSSASVSASCVPVCPMGSVSVASCDNLQDQGKCVNGQVVSCACVLKSRLRKRQSCQVRLNPVQCQAASPSTSSSMLSTSSTLPSSSTLSDSSISSTTSTLTSSASALAASCTPDCPLGSVTSITCLNGQDQGKCYNGQVITCSCSNLPTTNKKRAPLLAYCSYTLSPAQCVPSSSSISSSPPPASSSDISSSLESSSIATTASALSGSPASTVSSSSASLSATSSCIPECPLGNVDSINCDNNQDQGKCYDGQIINCSCQPLPTAAKKRAPIPYGVTCSYTLGPAQCAVSSSSVSSSWSESSSTDASTSTASSSTASTTSSSAPSISSSSPTSTVSSISASSTSSTSASCTPSCPLGVVGTLSPDCINNQDDGKCWNGQIVNCGTCQAIATSIPSKRSALLLVYSPSTCSYTLTPIPCLVSNSSSTISVSSSSSDILGSSTTSVSASQTGSASSSDIASSSSLSTASLTQSSTVSSAVPSASCTADCPNGSVDSVSCPDDTGKCYNGETIVCSCIATDKRKRSLYSEPLACSYTLNPAVCVSSSSAAILSSSSDTPSIPSTATSYMITTSPSMSFSQSASPSTSASSTACAPYTVYAEDTLPDGAVITQGVALSAEECYTEYCASDPQCTSFVFSASIFPGNQYCLTFHLIAGSVSGNPEAGADYYSVNNCPSSATNSGSPMPSAPSSSSSYVLSPPSNYVPNGSLSIFDNGPAGSVNDCFNTYCASDSRCTSFVFSASSDNCWVYNLVPGVDGGSTATGFDYYAATTCPLSSNIIASAISSTSSDSATTSSGSLTLSSPLSSSSVISSVTISSAAVVSSSSSSSAPNSISSSATSSALPSASACVVSYSLYLSNFQPSTVPSSIINYESANSVDDCYSTRCAPDTRCKSFLYSSDFGYCWIIGAAATSSGSPWTGYSLYAVNSCPVISPSLSSSAAGTSSIVFINSFMSSTVSGTPLVTSSSLSSSTDIVSSSSSPSSISLVPVVSPVSTSSAPIYSLSSSVMTWSESSFATSTSSLLSSSTITTSSSLSSSISSSSSNALSSSLLATSSSSSAAAAASPVCPAACPSVVSAPACNANDGACTGSGTSTSLRGTMNCSGADVSGTSCKLYNTIGLKLVPSSGSQSMVLVGAASTGSLCAPL
ncbi:hypothetical protein BT63DRAFT_465016 [Microthyrium microscopicum]|uniref:Chitin-binding type-1 domain-containing protein n=1 Tax=Microthyrium microscopicum TaxID=703497 RepID=A0A6A6TVV3_9PEZI|nr:hypothetical protein BT63DRAFT_465016 [Microthyrium microscopicum]